MQMSKYSGLGRTGNLLTGSLPTWKLAFLILVLFSAPGAHGNELREIDRARYLSQLEEQIWLQDVEKLRDREAEAARLVQVDPHSTFGHYLLAQIYLRRFKSSPSQLKLLQQASDLGQQAIELEPESDLGYLIAAQVLDLMGYSESALNALQGDPKHKIRASWRSFFLKAQLITGVRPESEVESMFEKTLHHSDASKNIVIPYVIASIQNRYENKGDMIGDLKYWKNKHSHRLLDLTLAIALTEQQRYDEASKIYADLRAKEPDLLEASINSALLLHNHLKRSNESIELLKAILSQGKELGSEKRIMVMAQLARVYLETGQQEHKARDLFADVIRTSASPNEWLIFSHKAYKKAKKLKDFISLIDEIKNTKQGTGFIYALHGEVMSEGLELHNEAVNSFRSAILLEPSRSDFYNGLGLVYYRMNDMRKALATFHEATNIDPKDATSRYNEACVLAILGRSDEAIGSLRTAIDLDPKLQASAKGDSDFKSLWASPDFLKLVLPRTSDNGPP
jgi:tetratricopeptide (TPR) repeat protein